MLAVGATVQPKDVEPGGDDWDHGVVVQVTHGGAARVHWIVADAIYWEDSADLIPYTPGAES